MKIKYYFYAAGIILGLSFTTTLLWKSSERAVQVPSFSIATSWWPVSDTFQIGVGRYEQAAPSFRTAFLQSEGLGIALNKFKNKTVDAATLTIYEALLAADAGIPLKIVLLLDYTTGSDGLVANNSVISLADLKGKRIGVEMGTIAHFTVLKAMEKAGVSNDEVEFQDFNNPELLQQAFIDGKIDVAGTFEPYMSVMAKHGRGHIIFSSKEIPRAICDVLFVKASVVKNHPQAINHWINSWDKVLRLKDTDTDTYLDALNLLNGTPVQDIKQSFKGIHFTGIPENRRAFGTPEKPGYLLDSLREMESFMLKQGVLKNKLPLSTLIEYNSISLFYNQ